MFRVIVFLLLSIEVSAQTFNGAPFLAVGNTGIARENVYSLSSNPAGIARLEHITAALAYQQHFMLNDLNSQALYVAVPIKHFGVLGGHFRKYGVRGANSLMTSSISYAKSFGGYFQSSVSINHHQYQVVDYVSSNAFSADLGVQYTHADFLIGVHYRNISKSHFSKEVEQYLPHELAFGATYLVSKEVLVSGDVVTEFHGRLDYRTGVEYRFDPRFKVMGGAAFHPTQWFAGIGVLLKKLQVDMASSFHPKLGTSPQLALSYGF